MKRLLSIALALLLILGAASAEETEQEIFQQLEDLTFDFSSGVGAWSTLLTVDRNGLFNGDFHDSDMGDTGDAYPNGTVYGCQFHGQFGAPVRVNDYAWTLPILSLEPDEGQLPEAIEEGVRYITSAPYGLEKAKEVTLYLPGTPVASLPEGFMFWSHLEQGVETLPCFALWSAADESGFVSEFLGDEDDGLSLGIANPWREVTEEELKAYLGISFGIPKDAEDVAYYVLNEGELLEMQFSADDRLYNARIKKTDAFTDISGMYETWSGMLAKTLKGCPAVYWSSIREEEDVHLLLWYDASAGLMYSLSVIAPDLDGYDLTPAAEAVYQPVK